MDDVEGQGGGKRNARGGMGQLWGLVSLLAVSFALQSAVYAQSGNQGERELRFRVIERGASPDKSKGTNTMDSEGESKVGVRAIPEGLAEPMRQRRWVAAEEALVEAGERSPGEWFAGGWIAWNRQQWTVAQTRFETAIKQKAGLPDFSALYAARSAYKVDRYHRAAIMAAKVSTASSQFPQALYVLGESLHQLATSRDRAMTIEVMRAYLRNFPRGPDAARARLVLGDAFAAEEKFRQAAVQWEALLREHPTSQWASDAQERFDEYKSSLPGPYDGYADELPRDLQMARWEGMYGNHQSEAVITQIRETISGWSKGTRDRCQALYWVARSMTKLRRHADAIEWYDRVLTQCEGVSPFERNALYMMGKSQWNAGQLDAALESFERLWREYPAHTFADDVMYFAARIHRERENSGEMVSRLEKQLKQYPKGDYAPDARWLLLRGHFADEDWSSILEQIDRWQENPSALGTDQYSAGRLTYARGRALVGLGKQQAAKKAYRRVVKSYPLGYYALLAMNRLAGLSSDETGGSSVAAPPDKMAGGEAIEADAGTEASGSETREGVELCAKALAELCGELVAEGRELQFGAESVEENADGVAPAKLLELPERVTKSRLFETGHRLLAYGAMALAAEQFREVFELNADDEDVLWGLAKMLEKAGAHALSHNIARRRIDGWKRAYPAGDYAEMWRIAYPKPFDEMVRQWSDRRGLAASLVWGLMREESGFAPEVGSWAGAVGLMQLMPDTAQTMARRLATSGEEIDIPERSDLTNPTVNVQIGTGYLARLSDELDGHPALMVAGYNAGLGNVSRWLDARGDQPLDLWVEDIPYGQTRRYVKRVLASYFAYTWLSGQAGSVPTIRMGL